MTLQEGNRMAPMADVGQPPGTTGGSMFGSVPNPGEASAAGAARLCLTAAIVLVLLGIVMRFSVETSRLLSNHWGSESYLSVLWRDLRGLLLPGVAYLLTVRWGARVLLNPRVLLPGSILLVVCLGAVFVPHVGIRLNGASRWVHFGWVVRFQPGEVARLSLIPVLAFCFWPGRPGYYTVGVAFSALLGVLLLMEPSVTVMGMVFSMMVMMMFLSEPRRAMAACLLLLVLTALMLFRDGMRIQRTFQFLHPDFNGPSYQLGQSLLAYQQGRLWGVGVGAGVQKLGYLPEARSDFIIAVIGEELGLAGVLLVTVCFAAIMWSGTKIASCQKNGALRLLAFGCALHLVLPAVIQCLYSVGLMPVTGVPLPFISAGGTAMYTDAIAVGILISLGQFSGRRLELGIDQAGRQASGGRRKAI